MTKENTSGLTYAEAKALSLTVKWKIGTCTQGEQCWCRTIEPTEKITDQNDEEIYIVGSGCMTTDCAEHIVALHNKSLNTH